MTSADRRTQILCHALALALVVCADTDAARAASADGDYVRYSLAASAYPVTDAESAARLFAVFHDELDLSGRENFECHYTGERHTPGSFTCAQTAVRSYPAEDFRSRILLHANGRDGHEIRCRCVSEDVDIPEAAVTSDEAYSRARRYVLAHHPGVDADRIALSGTPYLALQWNVIDSFRGDFALVWRVTLDFVEPRRREAAQLILSVHAADRSVVRVEDVYRNLRPPGFPRVDYDELQAERSQLSRDAQFEDMQRYQIQAGRGEEVVYEQLERMAALAAWEPEAASRFSAFFASEVDFIELVRFLEDAGAVPSRVDYVTIWRGALSASSLRTRLDEPDSLEHALREQLEAEKAEACVLFLDEPDSRVAEYAFTRASGLCAPDGVRFAAVDFNMNHRAAVELWEKEKGKRLLALVPRFDRMPPVR